MSVKLIGIIAEDDSDVEVLKILTKKLTKRRFSTSQFTGKGCGPLKRKTPGWCKALAHKGCQSVVLVHDLDRNKSVELRKQLELILSSVDMEHKFVVIPAEELEAWLLCDPDALKKAMNLTKLPKKIHHPEAIVAPKERMETIVKSHSKGQSKQYVNTVHNRLIAGETDVAKILAGCPSFSHFQAFITAAIGL